MRVPRAREGCGSTCEVALAPHPRLADHRMTPEMAILAVTSSINGGEVVAYANAAGYEDGTNARASPQMASRVLSSCGSPRLAPLCHPLMVSALSAAARKLPRQPAASMHSLLLTPYVEPRLHMHLEDVKKRCRALEKEIVALRRALKRSRAAPSSRCRRARQRRSRRSGAEGRMGKGLAWFARRQHAVATPRPALMRSWKVACSRSTRCRRSRPPRRTRRRGGALMAADRTAHDEPGSCAADSGTSGGQPRCTPSTACARWPTASSPWRWPLPSRNGRANGKRSSTSARARVAARWTH